MKNFLFILILSPAFMYGQNRVGINIDTPAFKLDIRSLNDTFDAPDFQLATPSANHFLRLFAGRDGDPRPFLLFNENDTFRIATSGSDFSNFADRITVFPNGNVSVGEELEIAGLSGIGSRNLVVDASGKVKIGAGDSDWTETFSEVYNVTHNIGIGTFIPTARLHIQGKENDLINATLKIFTPGPNPALDNTMFLDGNEIDVTGAGLELHLQSNSPGGIRMVTGGGNVGIGQSEPQFRKLGITGKEIPEEGNLQSSDATFSLFNTGEIFSELIMDANEIQTLDETLFINSKTSHNVIIASGGGNVAIGTESIAANYKLSVGGKIIAEELRVQLEGVWPDYVFSEKYRLKDLSELEVFVKKNKHLPGIPTAQEISDNGLALGEMQTRMMEKIEELTLYIIDLNKRIETLESENTELKSQ